ncbi:Putative THO complex, subunitTHOC2, THO complex subunit 2 domain-containing protein [Colletotrichum destructivum]|uniref:THO complex subunit 2 n=1 Tax=Colletotrichum destructivum TaxID=34406 RepID=A0AAX4IKR7_9PEZI|nr:Putative THO complex, subunitTHOC2, THO complex subunit 2 domain-containing protein [Colletotrichum destructivum]
MPPKRKARGGLASEGNRPSPHRPGDTALGQRDRDFSEGGGRGGRGGRNTRRNDRRDSAQGQLAHSGSQSASASRVTSPTVPRPPPTPSQSQHPAPMAMEPVASAPTSHAPSPVPTTYCYEHITDDAVASWTSGSKQALIDHGISSRLDVDTEELTTIYQEFIHAVVEGRLSPADAGACMKEILGTESQEMIKDSFSFEPHTLFLDTLSIIFDNDRDLFKPQLRDFIQATGVSPELVRQTLDAQLLQDLGLIRETFVKLGIRRATNLLYRQANYNLLREESEGYSKLMTELFTTSSAEPPSAETAHAAFERLKGLIGTFDLDVGRVLDVTLDVFAAVLIKQFRFFIKLLRVSSWWPRSQTSAASIYAGGLPPWALPDHSHWMTSEDVELANAELRRQRDAEFWDRAREVHIDAFFQLGGRQVTDEHLKLLEVSESASEAEVNAASAWMKVTKTLPPQGNRTAAQLLGFKLRFYASDARDPDDVLPANLLYLVALLVKVGFMSLVDIYPHLWPLDDEMDTMREKKMKELEEKEKQSRPGAAQNALLMAGALPDDTAPPPTTRTRDTAGKTDADAKTNVGTDEKDKLPEPMEQKAALLNCLLTIGAIPESLFILGRFPWLPEAYPEILDRIHRILNHSIEKVFKESRPTAVGMAECPAKSIADVDQAGVAKGTIKLGIIPVKKSMRWPFPDGYDSRDQHYRFYWDEWADNVPVCQTVDDVFTLCDTFLNLSGVNIGKDPALLAKLVSIGAKSLAEDHSQQNMDRWQELLRRILVPALSMTTANAAVVNSVWDLLKLYPVATRYSIYAEWFEGQISRLPAMKAAFTRTRVETRGVMKRISLTNLSEMAKSLAKTSYSSPGIVFKEALGQIESYANLIEAFVECAKYFTDLAYDVLVWSLMSSLGGQRSRTQESSILLTSKWLQALSKFAGKVFKRYSILDPTPILKYVNDQLFQGNSTDLIILKELVASMGGVVQVLDFTDDQILAMSGGEVLRRQTLLSLQDKRFESTRSAKRLMQSLVDSNLAGRVLINVAQYRQSAIYKLPDDEAHIKYIGSVIDDSHQILVQYLDLLRTNLEPHEFDSLVPAITRLMDEFGLDASLAFLIGREGVAHNMFSKRLDSSSNIADSDGDVAMVQSATDAKESTGEPNETEDKTMTPAEMREKAKQDSLRQIHEALEPIVESMRSISASSSWSKLSPEFYVLFWALQLGDIEVPAASYNSAHKRLSNMQRDLNRDRSDMSRSGINKKEAKKAELLKISNELPKEADSQMKRARVVRDYMTEHMATWFPGSAIKLNGISDAILEQCLLPRLVLSASDAEYCYVLIKKLHTFGAPNFRLKALYDRLFNVNRLRAIIFTCTVREAEHLGRFLNCILKDLARWHRDTNVYEREAVGKRSFLLGFASEFDDKGKPSSYHDHAQFRDILYGWHNKLNLALKSCLGGMEWMHIRNAMTVLKAVLDFFPAVTFMGNQFIEQLKTITEREAASKTASAGGEGHRVDLSVAAQGALSELQRRKAKWVLPAGFRPNMNGQAQGKAKDGEPSGATNLRPTAVEFKPGTSKTATEHEDGEVKDGRDAEARPAAPSAPGTLTQKDPNLPPKPSASPIEPVKAGHTRADFGPNASSKPSTPKPAAAAPAQSNMNHRDVPKSTPTPTGPDRSAHSLPKRPDVPIPGHYGRNHFTPDAALPERRDQRESREPRGPRDTREPRDSREHRDPRDSSRDPRFPEAARPERSRDFPNPDRRGPEIPSRETGRLSEKDWPARQDPQLPRRDHGAHERDSRPPRDKTAPVNGRTAEAGRLSREPVNATPPPQSTQQPAEDPPVNPARLALIQGEPDRSSRSERPPRSSEADRRSGRASRGQEPRGPDQERADIINPERAALMGDSRSDPLARPAREEHRDRGAPRTHSPRRSGRFNPDATADAGRDDRHGRTHHSEHRPSGRDTHVVEPPASNPRADRITEREGERFGPDKNREAFLGSSRNSDPDHSRTTQQDQNYGRLNPIQSVVTNDVPLGPRGRGRGAARGSHMGTPNSRPDPWFPPNTDSPTPEERHPPTGPASGRGRRSQYDPSASVNSPSTMTPTPAAHPDRTRTMNPGPTNSPTPSSGGPTLAPGIHPDRLAQIAPPPPPPPPGQPPSHSRPSLPPINTPDRATIIQGGNSRTPTGSYPGSTEGAPSGPSSNDRGRSGGSRRQLAGINSTLQQAQANMPESNRGTSIRGRGAPRGSIAGSDAQVLTGASPVSTPTQERPDPVRQDRGQANGDDHPRSEHDRSRREHRSERGRHSRRGSRERERSPDREREAKEPREHRDRRSGAQSQSSTREEREPRRSGREPSSSTRDSHANAPHVSSREQRHRSDRGEGGRGEGGPGGRGEDWGANVRGASRTGPRDGGLRPTDDRRELRDERGRKRRSEDAVGLSNEREKRQRR